MKMPASSNTSKGAEHNISSWTQAYTPDSVIDDTALHIAVQEINDVVTFVHTKEQTTLLTSHVLSQPANHSSSVVAGSEGRGECFGHDIVNASERVHEARQFETSNCHHDNEMGFPYNTQNALNRGVEANTEPDDDAFNLNLHLDAESDVVTNNCTEAHRQTSCTQDFSFDRYDSESEELTQPQELWSEMDG